ncbi:thiamine-phosphate kinase [Leptospirillum ferriphilum]|uniref:thiamine-phosphate kinase n=1 Tax=Leptospirillum ferriphilum TaxID=178606 RepID=UPI0006B1C443|nr:thiamine-phosphate kinase [Leptospirillum ferriphilum]
MESDWIKKFSGILGPMPPRVLRGIGDDVACLVSPATDNLLWTTDSQREGVHFLWDWMTPREVGSRLLVVNLSDVYVKGGTPVSALVALGIPKNFPEERIFSFYEGLADACRRFDCPVVGGDISRATGGFDAVLSLLARSPAGRFPGRDGLLPGDMLYLLGRPGLAKAGYSALLSGLSDHHAMAESVSAFCRPRTYPWFSELVNAEDQVVATMDTSDGLGQAIFAMADQSGVSVRLDPPENWLDHLQRPSSLLGQDPFGMAWDGGEDYDILFAVRPGVGGDAISRIQEQIRGEPEKLIPLGEVVVRHAGDQTPSVTMTGKNRRQVRLERTGFDHTR